MNILIISYKGYSLRMKLLCDQHYYEYLMYLVNIKSEGNDIRFMWIEDINKRSTAVLLETFKPEVIWVFVCDIIFQDIRTLLTNYKGKVPIIALVEDYFYLNYMIRANTGFVDGYVFKVKHPIVLNDARSLEPTKYFNQFENNYINTTFFHPWEEEKKYDIVIYGTMFYEDSSTTRYPFSPSHQKYMEKKYNGKVPIPFNFYAVRERMTKLLTNCGKFNVHRVISGNGGWDSKINNDKLSRVISQGYLCLSTKEAVDKCFMRYLEIAASDTAILGEIPSSHRFLFENNIVEFKDEMSDEEIISIVENALKDKKRLIEMGKTLGKKVREMYGHENTKVNEEFIAISKDVVQAFKEGRIS